MGLILKAFSFQTTPTEAKQVFEDLNKDDSSQENSSDNSDESDVEENVPRPSDTVLLPPVQPEPIIIEAAPGQHGKPTSVFQDNNEELCFPEIFQGEARQQPKDRKVPVRWADLAKAEVNNMDRRCATHIPNIFYKLRKSQIKNVTGKVAISTRGKRKPDDGTPLQTDENV